MKVVVAGRVSVSAGAGGDVGCEGAGCVVAGWVVWAETNPLPISTRTAASRILCRLGVMTDDLDTCSTNYLQT
jgi:hypothetical protein